MTEMQPRNATIKLSEYQPHPRNYNRHPAAQVERIAHSLATFGQVRSIVVWRGYLLAGHGVAEAAKALGWGELRADVLPDEYPEHLALAYVAADNELSRLSDPDLAQLASILDEAKQTDEELLRAIGYDDDEFEQLLREVEADAVGDNAGADTEPEIDKAEELRQKWGVEAGQLWQLGDHRLICGDCTDADVVARVMGGELATLGFTSPPYADRRKYDEDSGFRPIAPNDYVDWFSNVIDNVASILDAAGTWFVNICPGAENRQRRRYVIDLVVFHLDNGWFYLDEYAWPSGQMPLDPRQIGRFKQGFEMIYGFCKSTDYKFRPDNVRHESNAAFTYKGVDARISHDYQGSKELTIRTNMQDVGPGLAYPSTLLSKLAKDGVTGHAAAFPVGLPSFFVNAYTDAFDIVYEPFSGSGTTIIACENLKRRCRAVEISPGYVAVALERWHQHTGKMPELLT